MAIKNITAILKNRSAASITLSVLVSFLFVFAFATSTTTISSTGITATGNGSFARLGIGTTTDPLYGLKAAKQNWYFDVNKGFDTEDHVVLETNGGFRFGLYDTVYNQRTSYVGIWDGEAWLQAVNVASGTTASLGVQMDSVLSDGIFIFEAEAADNSGAVAGSSFRFNFSGLNQPTDSYTAFKLNVTDTISPDVTQKTLMDLQVGGISRFKVSEGQTDTVLSPTELVTNGTFDTASDWTFATGWSFDTDHAVATGVVNSDRLSQNISIVAGQTYAVTYTISSYVANGGNLYSSLGGANSSSNNKRDVNGTFTDIITTANDTDPLFFEGNDGFTAIIDNVSVKKIDPAIGVLTLSNALGAQMPFRLVGNNSDSLNIAIGLGSGAYLSSGSASSNNLFGYQAGGLLTSGVGNNFFGTYAGPAFQSGSSNSFFGDGSAGQILAGDENSFFGARAGQSLDVGSFNTMVGSNVAQNNWGRGGTYSSNTFVGAYSAFNIIFGDENAFLGNESGYSTINGYRNTYLGSQAGYGNQNGYANTVVGRDAFVGGVGSENSMLGWNVGTNYLGADATYLGTYAGNNELYGHGNTAIGYHALEGDPNSNNYQSTGAITQFIDNGAGGTTVTSVGHTLVNGNRIIITGTTNYNGTWDVANVSGDNFDIQRDEGAPFLFRGDDAVGNWYLPIETANTALGYQAGQFNTTGINNFFGGYRAGYGNTVGMQNTYLGSQAGYGSTTVPTTGESNTFVGYQAGLDHLANNQNVFLGTWAGYRNIDGQYNVMLGAGAGNENLHGSGNVFLGNYAGQSELGSDRFYVANSDPGDFTTASSSALIYGEFDNRVLAFNANVGIGTTTPTFLEGFSGPLDLAAQYPAIKLDASSGQAWQFGVDAQDRLSLVTNTLVPAFVIASSTGSFGLGFDSPLALLTVGSSTPAYLLPTQYYNSAYISGQLEVGGTATSTFAGDLQVYGDLMAKTSFIGDLVFANAFKFYEDPMPINRQLATGTQSLKLTNQRNEDIFSIDEDGNLTIKGQLKQSTTTEQSVISLGLSWVLDQFKTIGVTIADGIISAKEFIAEKVTGDEIKANQQICIGSRCLTEAQLGELLDKNGIGLPAQASQPASSSQPQTQPVATPDATTTPVVTPEPALVPAVDPVTPPAESTTTPAV